MILNPDDPKLSAYALGEVAGADRAAIEAELPQSSECRQTVEEIRATAALLEEHLAAEPCPLLDPKRQAAVLTALEKSMAPSWRLLEWFAWFRCKPVFVLGGTAAVIALILVLQKPSTPPPTPAGASATGGQPPVVPLAATADVQVAQPAPQPPAPSAGSSAQSVVSVPAPPSRQVIPPKTEADPPVQAVAPPAPGVVRVVESSAPALALVPLPLTLPMPSFKGTPDDLPKGPHIEPFSDKPRPAFMAPAGVQNVALNKKVTSSDKSPITGTLSQITDGNKDAIDDAVVEMHKNVQWVQIDLEQDYDIYALVMWHDHRYVQVFRCVVVQVADDPDFTKNVQTLFNNDIENTAGLGIGKDKQYFETNQGKLLDTKGIKGRYLRFYSKGSNTSALNCYTEIEVYGLPAH